MASPIPGKTQLGNFAFSRLAALNTLAKRQTEGIDQRGPERKGKGTELTPNVSLMKLSLQIIALEAPARFACPLYF